MGLCPALLLSSPDIIATFLINIKSKPSKINPKSVVFFSSLILCVAQDVHSKIIMCTLVSKNLEILPTALQLQYAIVDSNIMQCHL